MSIVLTIVVIVILFIFVKGLYDHIYYICNKEQIDQYYYNRLLEHKQKVNELRKTIKDNHLLNILNLVENEIDIGLSEYQCVNKGDKK